MPGFVLSRENHGEALSNVVKYLTLLYPPSPCRGLPPPPFRTTIMRQCLYIQCQNLCVFLTCKVSKSINVVRPRSFEVSESIISPLHHCPPPSHVVHLTEDLGDRVCVIQSLENHQLNVRKK